MKNSLLLFALFSLSFSFAQLSDIPDERIDQLVMEYDSYLYQHESEDMLDYVPHITISSHLIKRAIGGVDHAITIYFDRNDVMLHTETDSWEEYEAVIRKATFTIKSGSYQIHCTYHFDENGRFILATQKNIDYNYGCFVKNYYFENGDCFKTVLRPFEMDENCESTIEYQESNKLNDDQKAEVVIMKREVEKLRKILELNYALMMEN